MRTLRSLLLLLAALPLLWSCDKTLDVNAEWKDITVVYGLIDQGDSIHYVKVTKAFLGEGNALTFAKISDSSNYPVKLDVTVDEYYVNASKDSVLNRSFVCDTLTIHDKEAGDSIFYYPDQLMYAFAGNIEHSKDSGFFYKLKVIDPRNGKVIQSKSNLVDNKFSVEKPPNIAYFTVNFLPGLKTHLKWSSARNGKRYQVVMRLLYLESLKSDPSVTDSTWIEWMVIKNLQTDDDKGGKTMEWYFPNNGFYGMLHANIPVNPDVNRAIRRIEYVFSVASDDLNTYMEVTEPSSGLVQERPAFSNIQNGLGIFASRAARTVGPLKVGQETINELRVNELTKDLGF